MKKNYIAPQTSVYAFKASECILSGSPQIMSSEETAVDSDVLGREDNSVSNVWDSEW